MGPQPSVSQSLPGTRKAAMFLMGIGDQIGAEAIRQLAQEQAGPLMTSLPPEVQPQVALRIALTDRISPEVFRRIADAIPHALESEQTVEPFQRHAGAGLQSMSARSAEMMAEDMEALGPVRIRDVTSAQQQVFTVIRQLQKEGAITARSGGAAGGGDEYVV